jgi:hypothetical protein
MKKKVGLQSAPRRAEARVWPEYSVLWSLLPFNLVLTLTVSYDCDGYGLQAIAHEVFMASARNRGLTGRFSLGAFEQRRR